MSNDTDSHQLLAIVAAVHHQRVGEALDDGALGFAEALAGVAASGVRDVDGGADLDVIAGGEEVAVSSVLWRSPSRPPRTHVPSYRPPESRSTNSYQEKMRRLTLMKCP